MSDAGFTEDQFLSGRVKLKQRASGHRAGSDAVLLAATIPPDLRGLAIDVGASSGAVGLMAVWRAPHAQLRLIEIDKTDLAFARENIVANAMQERVTTYEADLFASHAIRMERGICAGDADLVLSNPPFLDEAKARASHDDDRVRAHMMPEGGLEKWILACLQMLKPNGVLTMIHRADRLDDVLDLMTGRFGDIALLPIYPRAGDDATRILISGKRNSRAPLRILPALILHRDEGGFTERAASVHAGHAALLMR